MFFHLLPKSSIKVVLEQNVIELQKNCHENVMEPIRFEINYSWVWRIFFQLTNLVMNGDYQNVLSVLGLSTMTTYKISKKLYQYQMRTGWKHKNKSWENNHVYNISRWTKCYLLRKSMDLGGRMVKVLDLWQQLYHWPGFVPLYPLQVLMLPGLLYHCI